MVLNDLPSLPYFFCSLTDVRGVALLDGLFPLSLGLQAVNVEEKTMGKFES